MRESVAVLMPIRTKFAVSYKISVIVICVINYEDAL